jgi:nicotinamidase-related amidase
MALRRLGLAPNAWYVDGSSADLTRPPPSARRDVWLAADRKRVRLDLARCAMVVVDMQRDFCHPDGWLAHQGIDVAPARRPLEPLQQLLPALRAASVPVLWLNWGNRPDLLNVYPCLRHVYNPSGSGTGLGDPLPPAGTPVLVRGAWGAGVVDELAPPEGDVHVDKYRMSGFWTRRWTASCAT